MALHFNTLHHIHTYITLPYITLHCIALHCITLHYNTYIHTYIHACMHACMHTNTYIQKLIHKHIHTKTYIHLHIHIDACIHTYCITFLLTLLFTVNRLFICDFTRYRHVHCTCCGRQRCRCGKWHDRGHGVPEHRCRGVSRRGDDMEWPGEAWEEQKCIRKLCTIN